MAMTLITTNTSSNAASSSFTSGIDSTYKLFIFKFIDINLATDAAYFVFNGSTDGGSNYNVTKTCTNFHAFHGEDGSGASLAYLTGSDLAQSTGNVLLSDDVGNGSDESSAGTLWLFNPSNTTYVKHWYSRINNHTSGNESDEMFTAGYFNTTSAINAVIFQANSGNMDGTIKLYGVG